MTTVEENIQYQNAVRQWGEAMLPLLYPGALVMMFAGPRMWEWVATGMQLAGFEHWETIIWVYAQGFPKAQDIAKLIDKRFGMAPSKESEAWGGYKTAALKPAYEPILCFRAPRAAGMTYAELALRYGTGALNVDAARIGTGAMKWDKPKGGIWKPSGPGGQRMIENPLGRYPANLILDETSAIMLDQQSGVRVSRFFFCPKPSKREREAGCEDLPVIYSGMSNGAKVHGAGYDKGQDIGLNRVIARKNDHPCVKPLTLCHYLASLLLPPASVAPRRLLVPFLGSGSEMIGALQAGWDDIVGVEQNAHFCEIANRRIEYWRRIAVPAVLSGSRLVADLRNSLN